MSLKLNTESAKQADSIASSIREPGKYIGIITRAEKLRSAKGTAGLGLSFKSGDGATADYLDIYTTKDNGDALAGAKTVNALLACLKLREVSEGQITCEKWSKATNKREKVTVGGYPDMMGKRIGLLLQKELGTNSQNGSDTTKMVVFGVFSAETELTASEILEGKTNPQRLPLMVDALMARPVRDNRDSDKKAPAHSSGRSRDSGSDGGYFDGDDGSDIPF